MIVCYKGVKGSFETVLAWYKDLFQHTEYLCRLLKEQPEFTQEQLRQVLQIVSCGCFSKSVEVTKLCLQLLRTVAQDLSMPLKEMAKDWMLDKKEHGGCFIVHHSIINHPGLAQEFVATIAKFCFTTANLNVFFFER